MVEYHSKAITLQSGGTRNYYYKTYKNGGTKKILKGEYLKKTKKQSGGSKRTADELNETIDNDIDNDGDFVVKAVDLATNQYDRSALWTLMNVLNNPGKYAQECTSTEEKPEDGNYGKISHFCSYISRHPSRTHKEWNERDGIRHQILEGLEHKKDFDGEQSKTYMLLKIIDDAQHQTGSTTKETKTKIVNRVCDFYKACTDWVSDFAMFIVMPDLGQP